MKALTIWQPWASLIMAGAKPYEFRGWRTPRSLIGQRIVIHAAARKIDQREAAVLHKVLRYRDQAAVAAKMAAETCLHPDLALPILARAGWPELHEPLPMACGLGTAIIGEPRLGTDIATEFLMTGGMERAARTLARSSDQESNWGWPLTDIEIWPTPIPMRGAQGFWNWPDPASAGLI